MAGGLDPGGWRLSAGGFDGFHFLGECPQGAVHLRVLINAFDLAGLTAGNAEAASIALDVRDAAADQVFLRTIHDGPEARI